MKKVEFTEEELGTLIWAINNQYAESCMQALKNGKKSDEDEIVQRLNVISTKAYSALVN